MLRDLYIKNSQLPLRYQKEIPLTVSALETSISTLPFTLDAPVSFVADAIFAFVILKEVLAFVEVFVTLIFEFVEFKDN